jgi:AraC-like DNA-binding protein
MTYGTYAPDRLLSPYIKFYWTLEDFDASICSARERIFPDGRIELLFHYGDLFQKYIDDDQVENQPRSFLHGQIRRFIDVRPTGKTGIFSIRFEPHGLYPFLKQDVGELTDNTISTHELWGLEGQLLEERIVAANTTAVRIQIVENFLIQRMRAPNMRQDDIDYCIKLIDYSDGLISVEKLSSEVNVSRRHLERKFIERVGITPKLLARITRFQKALNMLETNSSKSLTTVAYEGGFYDQSHFIRDFKEFTGYNPNTYFARNMEFTKYLAS